MRRPQRVADWPPEVMAIYANDLREMWDPSIERQVYNQYRNQLDLYFDLANRCGARTVLDVGCAQGTLALLLAENGRSVTAVDIRESFIAYGRTRHERGDVRFVAANIFDKPDLGTFDLVFANQIIEHLVYPAEFLASLAAYVRLGGHLVVSTPNHGYFRSRLPSFTELGDPAQHEHRQFSAGGGDHFFAYTTEELHAAALQAGLDIADTIYFESPWISGHFLFRFLHPLVPVGALRFMDRLSLGVAPRLLAHQIALLLRKSAQ